MERVLIVNDDQTLLTTMCKHLHDAGYFLLTAEDGVSGLQDFYRQRPSVVILDTELPGMDGWTVASRIREVSDTPLIMLPGEEEKDVLRAFMMGADDCVCKPISGAVLVARVAAVLRRTNGGHKDQSVVYTSGDLTIDITRRRVMRQGQIVDLTPTEFRLLALLARHAGRPLSHAYLLAEVWGPGYEGEVEYTKRYVWSLRKKLEDDLASPSHLLTERGFGYRFE